MAQEILPATGAGGIPLVYQEEHEFGQGDPCGHGEI